MGKFNVFSLFKYGRAAMSVLGEVAVAWQDRRLELAEILKIVRLSFEEADIKGVDVSLIQILPLSDGGFDLRFPGAAVKDWAIDFNDATEFNDETSG